MTDHRPTFVSVLLQLVVVVFVGILAALLLPLIAMAVVCWLAYVACLYLAVWGTWLPRGLDCLVVYSNSPHWQAYFESKLLPAIGKRAVVLNWSQRESWPCCALDVLVFRCFGGRRNFNPLVVVFRPFRRARAIRLYEALRDAKHGRFEQLSIRLQEISHLLGVRELPEPRMHVSD